MAGTSGPRTQATMDQSADEARARITTFLPGRTQWPVGEERIFFGTHKLDNNERLRIGSFLIGNGCDASDIYNCLAPRLGNDGNHRSMRSWLHSLQTKPDVRSRYWYFNLLQQDFYFQDGRLKHDTRPPQPLVRRINAWDQARFIACGARRDDGHRCRNSRPISPRRRLRPHSLDDTL